MALRKILNKSDEILHKVCKPVTEFDDKLGQLLDDMTETLKNANGVGLAGPQVAKLRRVVVIIIDDKVYELINPEITWQSEEKQRVLEGCLSCALNLTLIGLVTYPHSPGHERQPSRTLCFSSLCHVISGLISS